MEDILQKVATTVRNHRMLPEAGCAVLAVSGGPDSLALLHLIGRLRDEQYPALRLHVGHLHHGMRGAEADEDARFVSSESARLGFPCTIEHADVPRAARERGIGLELAGREARYAFLTRLARSLRATRLLLAHHADDQAETVLMRAIRGAGPRGMRAIPYVRPADGAGDVLVVRPLLECSRREIERFLREQGLPSRLDRTNLSPHPLRNRIRSTVLPEMENQWGPGLREALSALAATAQRFHAAAAPLRNPAEELCNVTVRDEYAEVAADSLRGIPDALLGEWIQRWLKAAGLWSTTLSARHYDQIFHLLASPDGALTLPGDLLVHRTPELLVFRPNRKWPHSGYAVTLRVPGRTVIAPLNATIETETILGGKELLTVASRIGRFEELLDMDRIRLPLIARFYRPGDRMKPLGGPGRRRLQDIFTDLRIPPWQRPRTLLITMADRPIWIVGLRIADAVKLTPQTRNVLRLRLIQTS